MTLSPVLLLRLPMLHPKEYEAQLELEIFFEAVLKKKNYLKSLMTISSFEIDLIFFYIEYD